MFVDMALENRVFHFLPSLIFTANSFTKEEFYQRRMHTIVTDFLTLMPLKIKVGQWINLCIVLIGRYSGVKE